jgi:hypothetical protein
MDGAGRYASRAIRSAGGRFHPEETRAFGACGPPAGELFCSLSWAAELRCEQGVGYESAGDEEQERATASGE